MKKRKKNIRGKRALKNTFLFIVIPILLSIFLKWRIGLIFFLVAIIIKAITINKRGYLIKDRKGNKVIIKDFFKRWKDGIEGITPLQQSRTTLLGTWIVISGIIAGILINALVRMKDQWIWIEVILAGSFILTLMQLVSSLQKYWRFKEVEKIQKKFNKEMEKFK